MTPDYDAIRKTFEEIADATADGPPKRAGKQGGHNRIWEGRMDVPKQQPAPPDNSHWWVGLIACVLVAVAAQSHVFPEPWSHVVSICGTVGAAVNGYLIRR